MLIRLSLFQRIYNKLIAIDLSKQQALLDAVSSVIQQINFTVNLDRVGDTTIFFILQESKETILDFSQECFSRNKDFFTRVL